MDPSTNPPSSLLQQRLSPYGFEVPAASTLGHNPVEHTSQHSKYSDYAHMNLTDHILGGSSTIIDLFKAVAGLVPHAGPVSQILGVTKELIGIVNEMRDNKEDCEYLIERILVFMKGLVEESLRSKVPLREGTATVARLKVLSS